MKSYPITFLLLCFSVQDALAAAKKGEQKCSFVLDHDALLATKRRGKALTESPRVYKSSKQFDETVSRHMDSLKACYF
jgi:hypothetical protein